MIPIGTVVRITGDQREYEIMGITEDNRYIIDQSLVGWGDYRYRGGYPKIVNDPNQILVQAEEIYADDKRVV